MALNSLYCADVPLSSDSLTHSFTHSSDTCWYSYQRSGPVKSCCKLCQCSELDADALREVVLRCRSEPTHWHWERTCPARPQWPGQKSVVSLFIFIVCIVTDFSNSFAVEWWRKLRRKLEWSSTFPQIHIDLDNPVAECWTVLDFATARDGVYIMTATRHVHIVCT